MIDSLTIQRLPFSQTSTSQRGNKGLRLRTEVSENQSTKCLHWISDVFDPVFERAACRLRRLLQAFAGAVKFPTVIRATNPLVIDSPIRQGSQPMRAMFADQPVLSLLVAINHQFFPENLDRL